MQNHVILTLGRSGSNTLVDLCNQHPSLLNYGEVLGDWNTIRKVQRMAHFHRGDDEKFLDALLSSRSVQYLANSGRSVNKLLKRDRKGIKRFRNVRSVGFKEFSLNFGRRGLRNYLRDRPHIKVIGLQRHALLDRLVSTLLLQKTGVVAQRGDTTDVPKLVLNPDTLVKELGVIETENNLLDEMLSELPQDRVFRIDYAELYSDPATTQNIAQRIFNFLDVGSFPTEVRMKKIVNMRSARAISNLDECRKATSNSRFDHVFDEVADV